MDHSQEKGASYHSIQNTETSLLDIIMFVNDSWRLIVITGLAGLVASCIYLLITPAQYESAAMIMMARSPAPNNAVGANIEEPGALIARISLPNELGSEVMNACGFDGSTKNLMFAGKSIKFAIPKGLASVVELKVMRPTPGLAKVCAQKIVESITQSQTRMVESSTDFVRAAQEARLTTIAERINQDKALLTKAEQLRGPITPTYFAILSEIRALEDEEVKVKASLTKIQPLTTQLQAAIEVSEHPVYPRMGMSLVAGVLGGLFLGVLIALARR